MDVFEKYFKRRHENVLELLKTPKSRIKPEVFHKLRVEIKKLDALFKRQQSFKLYKEVFDQAGAIRDIQVERDVMKKYLRLNALKDYRNQLRENEQAEIKKFYSLASKGFVSKMEDNYSDIIPFMKSVKVKEYEIFLRKQKKEIEKLMSNKTIPVKLIHELRIKLKAYYYLLNIKSVKSGKDKLTPLLGKWHDIQVILGHLHKTIDTIKVKPGSFAKLTRVDTHLTEDSNKLLSQIHRIIPKVVL
jgi:CHAD domain-containing protein